MNEFGILPKSYELILQSLNSYPEIESVLIFGSRAKGNYRNGSDVDLVIDGDKCSSEIALELSSILNERLPIPYYFDIVFLKDIDNSELKEHIHRVGKTFFERKKQLESN